MRNDVLQAVRMGRLPIRLALGLLVIALAGVAAAQEQQSISLAPAQPLFPDRITATGRVSAVVSARISSRVSGHIIEFGKDESGHMLDAGMRVKAGQMLFQVNPTTFANAKAIADAGLKFAQANLDNIVAKIREEKLEQVKAALAELEIRIKDRQRDQVRYRRLVEQEKTMPARRLEEVETEVAALLAQRTAAEARLREAIAGPTKTEIAVAEARVVEARAALKVAEDDLRDSVIKAPFDAVITQRFKSPGDYLTSMPVTEVLELVATGSLEAELRLSESYMPAVKAGVTQVRLRSPLMSKELVLPITRVIPDIDPVKGTFPVRVVIPQDPPTGLVAGAFVTAEVALAPENTGVIIPARAMIFENGKSAVFVAKDGKMVRRPVEPGDRLTEGVVVRSGLVAGEKVVVGPAESLKDGAPLPQGLQAN